MEQISPTPQPPPVAPKGTLNTTQVKKAKPKKGKLPTTIICSCFGGTLLLAIAVTGLLNSDGEEVNPTSSVDTAFEQVVRVRQPYVEQLTRTDRNPKALTNPGWRQQALANYSWDILQNAEAQRADPNSPHFRKSKEALLAYSQTDANELALLAELGSVAVLEYYDGTGTLQRIKVAPNELAAIAYSRLEAIDLAQNLQMAPRYSLNAINTELGNHQQQYKLAQAELLNQQGLTDSAAQLQQIQLWKLRTVAPTPQAQEKK